MDEFHHYIPQFILRYFHPKSQPLQTGAPLATPSSPTLGPNSVLFYDLGSKELKARSTKRVYGQTNLYRDQQAGRNVNHLEKKFSSLEGEISSVFRRLHKSLANKRLLVTRKELSLLRKFIFLMHYRNETLSSTYYQEDRSHNAHLVEWIRHFKKEKKFTSEIDFWRHGLSYYLEHDHHDIVAHGERLRREHGNRSLTEILGSRTNPQIHDWYALDYETQANYFFLGICEAADDSEFVLGGNSFGIWEGLIHDTPGAHKIYIVSPRIAIILRRTFLRDVASGDDIPLQSCLAHIHLPPPIITYANPQIPQQTKSCDLATAKKVIDAYRLTKQAQGDNFSFTIVKLSSAETYTINELVLSNADLHHSASLTFLSPDRMLRTLRLYLDSYSAFLGEKRDHYRPLILEILRMGEKISTKFPPSSPGREVSMAHVDTETDTQLKLLLRFIVTKSVEFPSLYNRAYLVFHMATDCDSLFNSVSTAIRRISNKAVAALQLILDPPTLTFIPNPQNQLVEQLSAPHSDVFFARLRHIMDMAGIGRPGDDLMDNLIYDAAIIGITHWFAANRHDLLKDLLFPAVVILA